MVVQVIDWKAVARRVHEQCRVIAQALAARGVVPGLAVIIAGDDAASKVHVSNKIRACNEVALSSNVYAFDVATPDNVVEAEIRRLNGDPAALG